MAAQASERARAAPAPCVHEVPTERGLSSAYVYKLYSELPVVAVGSWYRVRSRRFVLLPTSRSRQQRACAQVAGGDCVRVRVRMRVFRSFRRSADVLRALAIR